MAYTQEQLLKLAQGDPNFSTEYTYSQVQPTIAANKSKYASFLKNTKKHDLTVLNDKLDYTNTMNEIGKYIKLAK